MGQPFWRAQLPAIVIGLLNVFTIGFGMGVPVFTILLGFPVGWYLANVRLRRLRDEASPEPVKSIPVLVLKALLIHAAALTLVTVAVLAVIWVPQLSIVADQSYEAREWGIPLILYTSQASKIGWMVLMLAIAPAAQFMAVLTGAFLRLVARPQ